MQAVHAHGSRDVLDGVLADRLAAERQLARDLIVRRARDADAAALGQTFQTGRNVDAVAVEPLVLAHEAAVAFDVRAQDGGELSLDGASAHAPDGGTIGYAQPIA